MQTSKPSICHISRGKKANGYSFPTNMKLVRNIAIISTVGTFPSKLQQNYPKASLRCWYGTKQCRKEVKDYKFEMIRIKIYALSCIPKDFKNNLEIHVFRILKSLIALLFAIYF